ncbi:MAG: hypothetical protein Q8R81_10895 [Novosphingobium sp.]|uniref:hypothetical protein n=1 Tax=Novosphingobium sp. TaxID=1874826 RepID=UPI002732AC0C|nr:hypothetical protein [Novosphingobium sp.]MDP3550889.1 hypothetical protein [Novosphingobium sp.]
MLKTTAFMLMSISQLGVAPFILRGSEAKIADNRLELKACGIDKAKFARYYWYDAIAEERGYVVNTNRVQFAIFDEIPRGVYAVTNNPFVENPDLRIVAFGSYDILRDDFSVRCVSNS